MNAFVSTLIIVACTLASTNGFSFNGRTNINSKSSLQMNDVRKTENKRDRSLAGILESVEFIRRTLPPQIPLMDDPLIPMINVIVNAADARKATSISAFRISSITEITTFMVIVEGNSRPQNQAIALAVEEAVLVDFQDQPSKQGSAVSGWILLDYGSVIVHVMTPQMRNFYKLEKRWKEAEIVDLSLILKDNAPSKDVDPDAEFSGDMWDSEEAKAAEEEDPFWK